MKTYSTIQGDMWDSIAYKLFGTEYAINALIDANQKYKDIIIFPAGIVLNVPVYEIPKNSNIPPWER